MVSLSLVIEVLVILFLYVAPHILAYFFLRTARLGYEEPSSYLRVCDLFNTFGLSFLILYIALWEDSGLAHIGVNSSAGGLRVPVKFVGKNCPPKMLLW